LEAVGEFGHLLGRVLAVHEVAVAGQEHHPADPVLLDEDTDVRLRRDVRADEGDEEELPHPLPHRHAVDEVRDAGVRRGVRGGECQPALEQEHPDEG
jgi:hypothetical protein